MCCCQAFDTPLKLFIILPGVKSVRLLTNNPRKINGIERAGIEVIPVEIHIAPDNEIIANDLMSKARNLGHTISNEHTIIPER